ncbi:MAG TPA: response regulator transcription factor [Bryobacteraceae bacterium]|nr:response regulator transcription factor [Bryobacteraceae bacterium]
MAENRALKVAIIEDQARIREGLRTLIDGTEGYLCTGAFGTMEEAIEKIPGNFPDAVLVDIGLPQMSGIEGIRLLKASYPKLPLVMLTVYEDDKRIFDALCAGACGYLLKKTPPARLLEGLQEAVRGGAPMTPEVAGRVIALFREIRPPEDAAYHLTPHEIRILKLLVEGYNHKTAAAELDVSVNTIRFHLRSIYEKLQVHSKSEAVAKALRNRLIR